MNYMNLIKNIKKNDLDLLGGRKGAILSGAMACEILQMVINNSLDDHSSISDENFIKFSNELATLKSDLVDFFDKDDQDYLHSLKESAYTCKRVYKIACILKGNSASSLHQDLLIGLNLALVSFDGLVSLLKNELRHDYDENIKKEVESHIDILSKKDEFHKKLMDSPDY